VIEAMGPGSSAEEGTAMIRTLAARGIVDLLPARLAVQGTNGTLIKERTLISS